MFFKWKAPLDGLLFLWREKTREKPSEQSENRPTPHRGKLKPQMTPGQKRTQATLRGRGVRADPLNTVPFLFPEYELELE